MKKIIIGMVSILSLMIICPNNIRGKSIDPQEVKRLESYSTLIDKLVYTGNDVERIGLIPNNITDDEILQSKDIKGIIYLDIMDFDGDKKKELFYVYLNGEGGYVGDIWGFDNELYKVGSIEGEIAYTFRSHSNISKIEKGKNKYIYTSNGHYGMAGEGEFNESTLYTIKNKKLVKSKGPTSELEMKKLSVVEDILLSGTGVIEVTRSNEQNSEKIGEWSTYLNQISAPINWIINSKVIREDIAPIQEDGVTLVPLRKFGEELGIKVVYDNKQQSTILSKGSTNIQIKIGSLNVVLNGSIKKISSPAKIINGITMIPVRVISESFGIPMSWDLKTNTLLINSKAADLKKLTDPISEEEALKNVYKKTKSFIVPGVEFKYLGSKNITFDNAEYSDDFDFNPYRVQGRECYLIQGYLGNLELDGSIYVDKYNGKVYKSGDSWSELR